VVKLILLAFVLLTQFAPLARAGAAFAVDAEFAPIKAQISVLEKAFDVREKFVSAEITLINN
jgi:hypothetical protein